MNISTDNNGTLNNLKSRRTSTLKYSPSSTSLLGRTRKISSELPRPLKRSTSLTYRVFSSNQTTTSNVASRPDLNKSSSLKNIKRRFKASISRSSSISKFKSSSSTKSLSTMFTTNEFNLENIVSPPSSPTFSNTNSDNDNDNDNDNVNDNDNDDASNTSIFSHSSNSGMNSRDTSYNFSTFTKSNISSNESSPIKENSILKFKPLLHDFLNSNIFLNEIENDDYFMFDENNDDDLLTLKSISKFQQQRSPSPHKIFQIPEIVEIILRFISVDDEVNKSSEPKMVRRPPLSYNHSILMHGKEDGEKIWNKTISSQNIPTPTLSISKSNLFNCLLVNKQWYFVINQILNENLNFKNDEQVKNFNHKSNNNKNFKPEPYSIIFNKLKSSQLTIDEFSTNINPRRLNLIEFYICPTLLPPIDLISDSLNELVLPGCKKLTDHYLKIIISQTPNLKNLDIRACELITDASLYFLSKNCPKLEILNCGRHKRGEFITDISIGLIVKNCPIKTIGLAGCGISDWTIWEIAINCGLNLERLSINNCWKLTDLGICKVLKAELIENLKVLEIRNLNLQDLNEIVRFKKRCKFNNFKTLIEGCERIDNLMIETENRINLKLREKLLFDLNQWVNNNDDLRADDMAYTRFLNNLNV